MRTLLSSLVLLVTSVSCAGDMGSDSVSVDRSIQELQGEIHRHHSAVLALQTLGDVRAEAQRYDDTMLALMMPMHARMNPMDHTVRDMSHCSMHTLGDMRKMMDDMDTERVRHVSKLSSAATFDEVHSSCASHMDTMTDSLSSMERAATGSSCMTAP